MTLYYSLHSSLTCEDIFVNMFLEDHYRNVNNMGTNCRGWENRTYNTCSIRNSYHQITQGVQFDILKR